MRELGLNGTQLHVYRATALLLLRPRGSLAHRSRSLPLIERKPLSTRDEDLSSVLPFSLALVDPTSMANFPWSLGGDAMGTR